jgi:large-conductance mechanosensitive channel
MELSIFCHLVIGSASGIIYMHLIEHIIRPVIFSFMLVSFLFGFSELDPVMSSYQSVVLSVNDLNNCSVLDLV